MTAVLDAFQSEVWQSRSGPIPITDLSPEQANTAIDWGVTNAGELLRRHRERMQPDDYRAAANNPGSWWEGTELYAALLERIDADPSLPLTDDDNAMPDPATMEEPSPASSNGTAGDGHSAPSDDVEQETSHSEARELAVATRRAEESVAAADQLRNELNQLRAEFDNVVSQRDDADRRVAKLSSDLADLHESSDRNVAHEQAALETARAETAAAVEARSEAEDRATELESRATELEQQIAAHETEMGEYRRQNRISADKATKRLNAIVTIGTGIVLVSVAVLTYVGGYYSARHYAGWSPILAALLPLSIEAGAAVELASLVRNRRNGIESHWSTRVLAVGLLGMSITAMILHATNAPDGSFRWWGYVLAVGLPLELAALVRSALHTNDDHEPAPATI